MLVEIEEGLLLRLDCCLLTDLNLTNSGAAYSVSRGCFVFKPNPFKSSLKTSSPLSELNFFMFSGEGSLNLTKSLSS